MTNETETRPERVTLSVLISLEARKRLNHACVELQASQSDVIERILSLDPAALALLKK